MMKFCFLFLFWIFYYYKQVESSKILIISQGNLSHTLMLHGIGKELLSRGHEVSVIWNSEVEMKELNLYNYKKLYYSTNETTNFKHLQSSIPDFLLGKLSIEYIFSLEKTPFAATLKIANSECHAILGNATLMNKLQSEKYDIAIIDTFPLTFCTLIIPTTLNIPFVSVSETLTPWEMRIPFLPFISTRGANSDEKPSFTKRFVELLSYVFIVFMRDMFLPSSNFKEFSKYTNYSSFQEIIENSALFLNLQDTFITGLYVPKLPNVEFIGGITISHPKPIEDQTLNQWVSQANQGLIVVSFGSLVSFFPKEIMIKIFKVFGKLNQRVVIRFDQAYSKYKPENVPENVKLLSWIPQNDLLGHKNTILFISHAGTNGVYEALYSGVPLLMSSTLIPIQGVIAARVQTLGCGKIFDIAENDENQIFDLIGSIIHNNSYKLRAEKISKLLKHQKPVLEMLLQKRSNMLLNLVLIISDRKYLIN